MGRSHVVAMPYPQTTTPGARTLQELLVIAWSPASTRLKHASAPVCVRNLNPTRRSRAPQSWKSTGDTLNKAPPL